MTNELYFDRRVVGKTKIVKMGKCMGRDYCIVTIGQFPCAYVALRANDRHDFKEGDALDIVNGGITSGIGEASIDKLPPENQFSSEAIEAPYGIVGWNYGHWWDYQEYPRSLYTQSDIDFLNEETKKWTLKEIEDEVVAMCKWLDERRKAK